MNRIWYILSTVLAVLTCITSSPAKDWRGITPLLSTRTDVERLLGASADGNDVRSIYRINDEEVYIVFSGSQFCNSPTIRPATVLLVQVTPRQKPNLNELRIDRSKFREFRPSAQDANWKGLIDEEQGMIVRSYGDKVDQIFYFAAAKDRGLCPSYYSQPERFAQIAVDFTSEVFDEYSELAFADEKARLDNFAIYLDKEKPKWMGYIVVYSGRNGTTEARSRASRAKKYLMSLGLASTRISTIIGGSRNTLTTQLYAFPPDFPAPRPVPH